MEPAGDPTRARGTGSLGGRTRHAGLSSTAVTVAALQATHKPSASSRWMGRVAVRSA